MKHVFVKRLCGWFYCSGCGLLLLKNEATERARRRPCDG